MNEKKIEPTAAMVRDVECWRSFTGTADRTPLRPILRAALNHYDAPGLFECDYTDYVHVDEAATRVEAAREQGWDDAAQHIYNKGWEGVTALRKANPYRPAPSLPTDAFATNPPADADRPWEPLNGPVRVGDEVRQEAFGFAVTAVVARMDGRGDPLTAEGAIIGDLRHGTWYVRRPIQELPEADGAVIVPADGCQYIETRTGKKSRRLTWDAECLVWYDARGTHLHGDITPGTWQVADQ